MPTKTFMLPLESPRPLLHRKYSAHTGKRHSSTTPIDVKVTRSSHADQLVIGYSVSSVVHIRVVEGK